MNDQEAQAYDDGFEAFCQGFDEDANPYQPGTSLAKFWGQGWNEAFDDMGE